MHLMLRIKSTTTAVAVVVAATMPWCNIYYMDEKKVAVAVASNSMNGTAHFYHIEVRYLCALSASVDK